MGIEFYMRRISSDVFATILAEGSDAVPWHDLDGDSSVSKGWDVAHHLLCDGDLDNPPLVARAITGDVLIVDEDMPYGPPKGEVGVFIHDGEEYPGGQSGFGMSSPETVAVLADALEAITDEEFIARNERIDYSDAYSGGTMDGESAVYLLRRLQLFYRVAADGGDAVMVAHN